MDSHSGGDTLEFDFFFEGRLYPSGGPGFLLGVKMHFCSLLLQFAHSGLPTQGMCRRLQKSQAPNSQGSASGESFEDAPGDVSVGEATPGVPTKFAFWYSVAADKASKE